MEKNLGSKAEKPLKKTPKITKIWIWAIIFIFFFVANWIWGLFRTPCCFKPIEIIDSNEISQYLSNVILPQFYNKSQIPEPFEVVFTQEGIIDIVSRHIKTDDMKKWGLSDISITFLSGRILLTGKTKYKGRDFFVTAVFKPDANEKGMKAGLSKIKVGTRRIPFGVKLLRNRILYEIAGKSRGDDIVHYAGVLLNDDKTPAEFSFNHRDIKIKNISVEEQQIRITFLPE
ncbi:MAG: hypothetical protein ABFD79_07400 [Phycisphaerales bacterium]